MTNAEATVRAGDQPQVRPATVLSALAVTARTNTKQTPQDATSGSRTGAILDQRALGGRSSTSPHVRSRLRLVRSPGASSTSPAYATGESTSPCASVLSPGNGKPVDPSLQASCQPAMDSTTYYAGPPKWLSPRWCVRALCQPDVATSGEKPESRMAKKRLNKPFWPPAAAGRRRRC